LLLYSRELQLKVAVNVTSVKEREGSTDMYSRDWRRILPFPGAVWVACKRPDRRMGRINPAAEMQLASYSVGRGWRENPASGMLPKSSFDRCRSVQQWKVVASRIAEYTTLRRWMKWSLVIIIYLG
jgi:hypothetical protein